MCTVIIGFAPQTDIPLMLVGVRDEFAGRPWLPPDRHWPDHPGVIGGIDQQAGGTWLAVDPAVPRAAALLNGRGEPAAADRRRSRGELPLLAVRTGEPPEWDLTRYDPFHLVLAEPTGVRMWHWDGAELSEDKLPEGVHMIVNSGWERGTDNPRVAHFRPLFTAAAQDTADAGDAADGAAGDAAAAGTHAGANPQEGDRPDVAGRLESRWREWRRIASGAGLAVDDPRALVVRQDLGDKGVWGTSSITLLAFAPALAPDAVRYDFCPRPDDPSSWYRVLGEGASPANP